MPLAPSLTQRIIKLIEKIHRYSKCTDYLFPSIKGNRIDKSTVYRRFRDYLQRAGISHTSTGPRVHDLRYPNLNKIQTFFQGTCD
ncbi:tyrosine-type recombinase/integrase [Bacillus sp. Marseille-P3661]|uniref:tyrosine-type recombinase/integrase n=1 Tax=Bacillus sp. Marseille-P3661 TaxID=1936234 RepID=UPI0035B5178E